MGLHVHYFHLKWHWSAFHSGARRVECEVLMCHDCPYVVIITTKWSDCVASQCFAMRLCLLSAFEFSDTHCFACASYILSGYRWVYCLVWFVFLTHWQHDGATWQNAFSDYIFPQTDCRSERGFYLVSTAHPAPETRCHQRSALAIRSNLQQLRKQNMSLWEWITQR